MAKTYGKNPQWFLDDKDQEQEGYTAGVLSPKAGRQVRLVGKVWLAVKELEGRINMICRRSQRLSFHVDVWFSPTLRPKTSTNSATKLVGLSGGSCSSRDGD